MSDENPPQTEEANQQQLDKKMLEELLLNQQENVEQQKSSEIDIMEMLHKKKMNIIEKCFGKGEGEGLTIEQFVKVMLEHLEYDKKDDDKKMQITLALVDLFKEIDVNGDGTMEWKEFSDHIISLGMLRNDRNFKNIIKSYYPSEHIIDKEKHETGIEKVYYFQNINRLIVLEKDSPRFKVYNQTDCELICEVNAHKCAVLSAEFIPDLNLIATSSNDLTINFWDAALFNLKQIVSVPEIQLCMRYSSWGEKNKLLYTGGSDAIIHIYDALTQKEKGTMSGWNPFFKRDTQQYGHASPIGDILPIVQQSTLVTAGLDANICLWDAGTHSPKKELRGHVKGVYSLDWSDWSPMNQCLLSAGLDHEAFVWNTYVKEKIFLLRGHNHPLIGVKCLQGTPQVITADINGMVKVWDVRNFLCMQTINVPIDELNSFVLTSHKKKRIIFGARHICYYEYDEPKDQNLTDEKMCIRILYNSVMLTFITLHPDCIKVWDARDGKLVSVYRELSKDRELTACVLDERKRKLFVGDSEGKIFTVNLKNGAKLKKFERHHKMITDLVHWTSESLDPELTNCESNQDIRRVVSASREDMINIHDEDSSDPKKSCRYNIKQHKAAVNSLALKKGTELLASASDDGSIVITNLQSYRQENLGRQTEGEIKKVLFLHNYPCIVASDSLGNILFYAIHPHHLKNKVLLRKQYKTIPITKNQEEKFPATALAYNYINNYLIIGDEFGSITFWDLTIFLKKVQDTIEDRTRIKDNPPASSKKKSFMAADSQNNINNPEYPAKDFFDTQIAAEHNEEIAAKQNIASAQLLLPQASSKKETDETKFYSEKDIVFVNQIRKVHTDGITWIEVMPELNCLATSSFDCCCHLHNFTEFKKIGSLILGHDTQSNGWALKIDEEPRKQEAVKYAKQLIGELEDITLEVKKQQKVEQLDFYSRSQKICEVMHENALNLKKPLILQQQQQQQMSGSPTKEEKPETPEENMSKKQKIMKKAKKLIDNNKEFGKVKNLQKNKGQDIDYDEYMKGFDFVGFQEKDLYQDIDEEEEDDYHILNDLVEYKNQQLTQGAFQSKNAFKSKMVSKGHSKINLK